MSNTENSYSETDLGNVSPNPRGEYDPETSYEYLDLVNYKGGSYLCLAELETTVTGVAPAHGKNTDTWQLLTLPGDLTPEYIAMHDDVANKAKQVEDSRAAVEQSQEEIEASQADVQQLHSDTVEAAQEASDSRDSAAGYAQAAETSRQAAAESEQNVNAQITGFDTHVSESVTQAQEEIAATRQQAIRAVASQQVTSTQAVKDQTASYITEIGNYTSEKIADIQTTGETAMSNLQTEATKQQEYIKTSIDDTLSISGKAADAAVTGKKIDSLKEDVANKITKFYANNLGEMHITDSDNGKIQDMQIFGRSEQKKYNGYQLFALAPINLSTGEKVSLPYTENGITVDIANDGIGYTVRGTNTLNKQGSDIYLSMSNAFDIEAGTYTRSGKIINGNNNVELISGGGTSNGGCLEYRTNKADFTFTETVKKGKSGNFVIRISPSATVNAIVYFQIEKGSEAHGFEPYVGGQPSPSPDYPQEIKSVVNPMVRVFGGTLGNKLNNKQINWLIENMNIWHDNNHFVLYDEFGTHGSTRLVICAYQNDTNNYTCTFIDIDGNVTNGAYQIDIVNNIKNQIIYCNMLPIIDTNNVSMAIDVDSNKTVGLPNNYHTVTLPYTLNAIPVESGGNVTINGQQYIADYVDVERGKVVRNVENVTFNGAENENWELWNADKEKTWSFMLTNSLKTFAK